MFHAILNLLNALCAFGGFIYSIVLAFQGQWLPAIWCMLFATNCEQALQVTFLVRELKKPLR